MSLAHLQRTGRVLLHVISRSDARALCSAPAAAAWFNISEGDLQRLQIDYKSVLTVLEHSKDEEVEISTKPDLNLLANLLAELNLHSNFPENPSIYTMLRSPVVSLINICNLKCSYCYVGAPSVDKESRKQVTRSEVIEFAKVLLHQGGNTTKSIQLFGGEPTLHNEFVDIVRELRSLGLIVRVSTNLTAGKVRSTDFVKILTDVGVEWRVSIDSLNQNKHDEFRGQGNLNRVFANLNYAKALGANISLRATLTRDRATEIRDIAYYCLENNFQLTYGSIIATGEAEHGFDVLAGDMHLLDRILFDEIDKQPLLAKIILPSPLGWALKSLYLLRPPHLPRFTFYMGEDGSIYPMDSLVAEEFKLGERTNINWSKAERQQRRFGIQGSRCAPCPIQAHCYTGHFGDLIGGEDPEQSEFRTCPDKRATYKMLMQSENKAMSMVKTMFSETGGAFEGRYFAFPSPT